MYIFKLFLVSTKQVATVQCVLNSFTVIQSHCHYTVDVCFTYIAADLLTD